MDQIVESRIRQAIQGSSKEIERVAPNFIKNATEKFTKHHHFDY